MRVRLTLLVPLLLAADWPRFLGPTGDGSSAETGIRTDWPKDGLPKVWQCDLGKGYAPPVVAAGKLYHFDRFDEKARITCRDAAAGKHLWQAEYASEYEDLYGYDNGPRSSPLVDGDRVYALGVEGTLFCVSATDGKELWKIDTRAKYHVQQNFFGTGGAPVVEGDLLIVPIGGSPKGARPVDFRTVKANGTAIVAFDKKTGAVKYETGNDLSSYATPVVTDIAGRRLGVYYGRHILLVLDPATGKIDSQFPWRARVEESANAANPLIVGDKVLVSECYGPGSALVKLTPGKATAVWTDLEKDREDRSLASHWCTPIHHDGYVYGCSGRHANEADLRCLKLDTGEVMWTERRTTRCTLTKIDGHLLSLGENGELRLIRLNPAKYDPAARWESPDLDYPAWAPPVVSNGLLYVRGKDRLVCYRLKP
jgi:outer membrane protein assembly factor BamB